ncbi:IS3 family transposase [Ellagibacter isourolithinifaciens]|uniref:IS3 family transposase n=2 Tax=Ellagibacter isourolithinifaciens TaxID=2137581 RepID=UPI003A8D870A
MELHEYQRAGFSRREDRDANIRQLVSVGLFSSERGAHSYRALHTRMRRAGVVASEKRVRRVMPEEGVQLVRRQGVEGAGEPGRARFACPRARHATADQHHSHKAASPTETSSL